MFQLESTDDGLTWVSMTDITSMVKPVMDWKFIASGPSDGLQLPSGRFLICKGTCSNYFWIEILKIKTY